MGEGALRLVASGGDFKMSSGWFWSGRWMMICLWGQVRRLERLGACSRMRDVSDARRSFRAMQSCFLDGMAWNQL